MSGQILSSKVVVVEEEPRVRGIPSAPTSVAGAVGITERGPIDQEVLVTSFEEFQQRFGGFTPNSDLALAAMGFFENGGGRLWVVRTVHHADVSDPATATAVRASAFLTTDGAPAPAAVTGSEAEPFVLSDGDKLALSVNGGPDAQVVFNATATKVMSGAAGHTLNLRIDAGPEQTVIFQPGNFSDIGAAEAAEVAAAINKQIADGKAWADPEAGVTIASDNMGTASRVQVTGGTANAVLGFPTGEVSGTGNVADIAAVTAAEVKAVVEAAISGVQVDTGPGGVLQIRTTATGAAAALQVQPATAAAFGLDNELHQGSDAGTANVLRVEGKDPGAYANRVEVEVKPPTSGEAGLFDLAVIEDGVYRSPPVSG